MATGTSMRDIPPELQAAWTLLEDIETTNYIVVASLTLLLFDWVICLDKEARLIWTSKKGLANAIYIWTRYVSVIAVAINASFMLRPIASDRVCEAFLHAEGTVITLIVFTVDLVLVARVWILYGRSKTVLLFLLPLVAAEFISMIILDVFIVLPMNEFQHIGGLVKGCYSTGVPAFYMYMSLPPIITTFIMFIMTLYKCLHSIPLGRIGRVNSAPLLTLFLRDGLFWFLGVLAVSITGMVTTANSARIRPTLGELMLQPTVAVYSIISSRVLLNIKEVIQSVDTVYIGRMADEAQTHGTAGPVSELRFDSHYQDTAAYGESSNGASSSSNIGTSSQSKTV